MASAVYNAQELLREAIVQEMLSAFQARPDLAHMLIRESERTRMEEMFHEHLQITWHLE